MQERKNMKKLVLVEDAPWRVEKNLLNLKEKGVEIEKLLFFTKGEAIPPECEEMIQQLQNTLDTQIERIGRTEFYSTMDRYYTRNNLFILFDLNLEDTYIFEDRVNVRYANSKDNKGKGKIWFYTTGGKDLKSMLVKNFDDQLIDVEDFYENQLYWNDSQILQIAAEG